MADKQHIDDTPAEINVTVVRGDHVDFTVNLTTEGGDAAETAGFTAAGDAVGDADARIAMNVTIVGSSVRVRIDKEVVLGMSEASNYDVRLTNESADQRRTPFAGKIRVIPAITGPTSA